MSDVSVKRKKPFVPPERHETVRQEIVSALEVGPLTARELSARVKISEREVYDHLLHVQRQLERKHCELIIFPAACRKCGFRFRKRDRLTKPGRCPVCRGESIHEPSFAVRRRGMPA